MSAQDGGEDAMSEVTNPELAVAAPATPGPAYPSDLECDVTTLLGATVHVRPIRPDDAKRLVAFHQGLSSRSVYRRFFSVHPKLSDAEVARFTCVDYVDRLALVAEVDDQMVAVARYDRPPGSSEAEVAFVVADAFQHHGIATMLLELLAYAAWRSGISVFVASTLVENGAMLDVFRHSRFGASTRFTSGIVEVRFSIDPAAHRDHPSHPLEVRRAQPSPEASTC
jgi:RimJ/RimL family protein N-acetyltransferase